MEELTNLTNKQPMAEEEIAEASVKKKPRKKIFLILGATLLILVSFGSALIFFLQTSGIQELQTQIEEAEKAAGANLKDGLPRKFNPSEGFFERNPLFTEKMDFTINLADGKRYLNMSLQIGLARENALDYINQRIPIVKDIIITTTQSLTSEDFRAVNGVETYKRSLLLKLNSGVFTANFKAQIGDIYPIKRVLFDKFVLQ